jgi:hypothetical protein
LADALARLIDEASCALAELDADALEELGRRATALQALHTKYVPKPEIASRFRHFASVLQATGENLSALERVERLEGYGEPGFEDAARPPANPPFLRANGARVR